MTVMGGGGDLDLGEESGSQGMGPPWRRARVEGNHRRQAGGAVEGVGSEVVERRCAQAQVVATTVGSETDGGGLLPKRCLAVEGNTGGRGSPVVVPADTQFGKVRGAWVVLEDSLARSGNDWRRLPMARPSRWGKADDAAERRASPWHDASLRLKLRLTATTTHVDVAA
jgi:hypothetical protein